MSSTHAYKMKGDISYHSIRVKSYQRMSIKYSLDSIPNSVATAMHMPHVSRVQPHTHTIAVLICPPLVNTSQTRPEPMGQATRLPRPRPLRLSNEQIIRHINASPSLPERKQTKNFPVPRNMKAQLHELLRAVSEGSFIIPRPSPSSLS